MLPTGPTYYVAMHSGLLAKTAFSLELDANGALTKVTQNVESQVPDTINAVANLAKSLPLGALSAAAAAAPSKGAAPPCDTSEEVLGIQLFSDWQKKH